MNREDMGLSGIAQTPGDQRQKANTPMSANRDIPSGLMCCTTGYVREAT